MNQCPAFILGKGYTMSIPTLAKGWYITEKGINGLGAFCVMLPSGTLDTTCTSLPCQSVTLARRNSITICLQSSSYRDSLPLESYELSIMPYPGNVLATQAALWGLHQLCGISVRIKAHFPSRILSFCPSQFP